MEIIKKEHHLKYYNSRLFDRYFGGLRLGVFDIETMGLNPANVEVVLAGFLEVNPDGHGVVTQYFANKVSDEPKLLEAIYEEFKKYDVLLTFNGKHFDLPFISKRAEYHSFRDAQIPCSNLDLYLVLHGHSPLKKTLKSLKQKNIEDYMGFHIDRKDEISGADSVLLYEAYVEEQNPEHKEMLKEKILLHNHDDIVQLYRLLPILQQTNFHRAMSYLGFPVVADTEDSNWPQLNIGRIRLGSRALTVDGTYCGPKFSYTAYDHGSAEYSCTFSDDGQFQFTFYTQKFQKSQFLSLVSLLDETRLASMEEYPAYENGYLILNEGTETNFMEINMFVQTFLKQFIEQTPR